MNTPSTHRPPLHPVLWVAAIAVILLSITGIAAITGLIPTSKSAESPAVPPPAPAASAPAPVVAAAPAPVEAAPAPVPQPVVTKHHAPVKHHHVEQMARSEPPSELAPPPPPPPPSICNECGRIESVQRIVNEGEGSGVGAVAGGALGGVLGHQVGNGNGRTLATLAGLVGGAVLGNQVEKSKKQTVTYQTTVRFDDGSTRVFNNTYEQGFRAGERVRLVNGAIKPE